MKASELAPQTLRSFLRWPVRDVCTHDVWYDVGAVINVIMMTIRGDLTVGDEVRQQHDWHVGKCPGDIASILGLRMHLKRLRRTSRDAHALLGNKGN